jgi:anaerobic magnesium-protoporphyrin IX monomethyl ester cyclase
MLDRIRYYINAHSTSLSRYVLDKYRIPMLKGPLHFCGDQPGMPGGCHFCIKHVSYQHSVRVRSPENIMEELWLLKGLGIHDIHMHDKS